MTGSTISKRLTGTAAALVAAASLVTPALAAGEPKNQSPFTRAVAPRALAQELARAHASSTRVAQGETKNQLPFTRALVRDVHPDGFGPH